MRLSIPISAMAALAMTAASALAQSYETGMTRLSVHDTGGDRHTEGFLWYPTEESEGKTMALGNPVWESIQVIPDAEPAGGKRPLLVLSHGMFGNSRNQAWLAEALTREGYIVAAINHPGTSTRQRDPKHRRELWERPRDISRAMDHLLAMEGFGDVIDPDRIFMAGHSLGGFTALALAGGRFDPERVDATCEAQPEEIVCDILTGWGVAKTPEDRVQMAGDLSDPRIAAFAVFDLGGTQTFSPESISGIDRPMFVIGAPITNSGLDLDVESRALVSALPTETVRYLEPESLSHFDFLGVCTDEGLYILKKEEPDDAFICENGTDHRRAAHASIAGDVLTFFDGVPRE